MPVPKPARVRASERRRKHIRGFRVGDAVNKVPPLSSMEAELLDFTDVLMGRADPPITNGVMTLAEVANAYLCRARELEAVILKMEREGVVSRGSQHYKFRTGELRSFIDLATKAWELGSRRVTYAQMLENLRD